MATRLTGQAALEYLKNNPNASYVDNTTGTRVSAPQSGLSKFTSSITSPFRKGAGIAQEFGYTVADLLNAIQGKQAVERPESYALMSPEESQALYQDPLKTGLKAGAGVASFGIGGTAKGATAGARILSAAKTGAVGGSLGGFGYSEDGNELGSTLTGGAIGGVAGGALQGLSELLKPVLGAQKATAGTKLQKAGTEMRANSIGLKPDAMASSRSSNVKSSTEARKVIKDYFNTMDNLNLNTTTSKAASESTDAALDILRQDFDDILSQADNSITFTSKTSDDLIRAINSKVSTNKNIINSPVYQEIIADIRNLGDNYTPSQLNTVREKIRDTFINWNAKQGLKQSSQRAASTSFDVIDKFFKKNVSPASETLSKMNNLYTVRDFIQKKAASAGTLKLGTASTYIAAPTFGAEEAIGSSLGKLLQKTPSLSMRSGVPSQIAGKLAGGAGIAGGIAGGMTTQAPAPEELQQLAVSGTITSDDINAALEAQYAENQAQRMSLFNQLIAQGYKTSEAKSIVDMNIPQMKKQTLSEAQRKALAAVNSLANFENEYAQGGVLASELPFGGVGTQGRQLATARKSLIEDIGRLQTGAVINAEEAKSFKDLVPTLLDDAETAQLKIAQLRERLSAYVDLTPQYSTEYDALKSVLGIQ